MTDPLFNIDDILELLPHRYPFLLIDRVEECKPFSHVRAIKNVTMNEPFFSGHFPGRPVMPGVMILEAMAQTTGVLAIHSKNEKASDGHLYYFAGIDKARFKRVVKPGDTLVMEARLKRQIKDVWRCEATAWVDGRRVCYAELTCAKTP